MYTIGHGIWYIIVYPYGVALRWDRPPHPLIQEEEEARPAVKLEGW
jgi:hypothetical protein